LQNTEKQMATKERTDEKLLFECLHCRISSRD